MSSSSDLPWLLPLLVAIGAYLTLAVLVGRERTSGASAMGWVMGSVVTWLVGTGMELSADTLALFGSGALIRLTGAAVLPVFFLRFALEYTGRGTLTGRWLGLCFAIPLASIALAATNPVHEWMWGHPPVDASGQFLLRPDYGPWFLWVYAPYAYGLLLTSFVIFVRELFRASRLYRSQVAVLLIACTIPIVGSAAHVLGLGESASGAMPTAFAAAGLLLGWGFFRVRLFRLSPVAYHALFDTLEDAVVGLDHVHRVIDLNPAAEALTGVRAADVIGHDVAELFEDDTALLERIRRGEAARWEYQARDGTYREVDLSLIPRSRSGVRGRVLIIRDISGRRDIERQLRDSEAMLRTIVESSPNGILRVTPIYDQNGRAEDFVCVFCNPATVRFVGSPTDRLLGASLPSSVPTLSTDLSELFREAVVEREAREIEIEIWPDGVERWLRIIAVPLDTDLSVTFIDITERKRIERDMAAAAMRDPLTGLLNRRGFEFEAAAWFSGAERFGREGALLYADLDDFKRINDTHGHTVGDELLRAFAGRLNGAVRAQDLLGRFGGDEFVVALPDTDEATAREVASRVLREARLAYRLGSVSLSCGLSVGIALYPRDGTTLDELIDVADRSMYRMKTSGGEVRASGS